MTKKAIIVGVSGQDGSYLFELLEKKGYTILGIGREKIRANFKNRFKSVNILEIREVKRCFEQFLPDEIYYLAAFHHSSQDQETASDQLWGKSMAINARGLMHVLESMRSVCSKARLFYAASSHVFGRPRVKIQNEQTALMPVCVYGITKVCGIHMCRYYREKYGLFASVGILYNHESPRRQDKFVSQKIVRAALAIKAGKKEKLVLGDLNARADWGFAGDYVEAMHRVVRHHKVDEFVIASGRTHTVKDFIKEAFGYLKLDWRAHVQENPAVINKQPRRHLQGNAQKLKKATGWQPQVTFKKMIRMMIDEQKHG